MLIFTGVVLDIHVNALAGTGWIYGVFAAIVVIMIAKWIIDFLP